MPYDAIPATAVKPVNQPDGKSAKLARQQVANLIAEETPCLSRAAIDGLARNGLRDSGGSRHGHASGEHYKAIRMIMRHMDQRLRIIMAMIAALMVGEFLSLKQGFLTLVKLSGATL